MGLNTTMHQNTSMENWRWSLPTVCGNHSDRQACTLDHAQHPRKDSSVYTTAEDLKDTAAYFVALMMQSVTSCVVIYFVMLCLLCGANLRKDNLTSELLDQREKLWYAVCNICWKYTKMSTALTVHPWSCAESTQQKGGATHNPSPHYILMWMLHILSYLSKAPMNISEFFV